MVSPKIKVRGLGLCSGGLDSILAALVLRGQGIEVEWITFETPFFPSEKAKKASQETGIPLTVKNITGSYLEMLRNPKYGYGKHMNPCVDCHTLMFRMAGELMVKRGFDFLFSGEVLGQRPMSQTKQSLRYVEKNSGYDGYIFRPLSASLLPETIPEKGGLVDVGLLPEISGRSRKLQIKLAQQLGVVDYPTPAGGCLLTEESFSVRLKDLFDHKEFCTEKELHLLKYGRHFRFNHKVKFIVGRNKEDNEQLLKFHDPSIETVLKTSRVPGPVALIQGEASSRIVSMAASICAGYSKAPGGATVEVLVRTPASDSTLKVTGTDPSTIRNMML